MTYFDGIEATLYENWPDVFREESMKSEGMALVPIDALALGSVNPAFRERNGLGSVKDFSTEFTAWLEGVLSRFPNGAFIKTSYGSFRECPFSFRPSRNSQDAMSILRWPDDRIMRHAQHRLDFGGDVHVLVRDWQNLNADQEFRVFVHDRKIIAITPIYYRDYSPLIYSRSRELNEALRGYVGGMLSALHYDSIAFDLWVDYDRHNFDVGLIELTPFMPAADAGLFDWSMPEFMDGRFRLRGQHSILELNQAGLAL